jgi:hypothetical protein
MLKAEKIALLKSMNALPRGYSSLTSKQLDEILKNIVPPQSTAPVAATIQPQTVQAQPVPEPEQKPKKPGPVLYNKFIKEHMTQTGCSRREAQQAKDAWLSYKTAAVESK